MNALSPMMLQASPYGSTAPQASLAPTAAATTSSQDSSCVPCDVAEVTGKTLRALTATAGLSVAGAGAGIYLAARYTPQGMANAYHGIWTGDGNLAQKMGQTVAATLLIPTVFPVMCVLGSTFNGLDAAMNYGYEDGLESAARHFAGSTIMADYHADVITGGKA